MATIKACQPMFQIASRTIRSRYFHSCPNLLRVPQRSPAVRKAERKLASRRTEPLDQQRIEDSLPHLATLEAVLGKYRARANLYLDFLRNFQSRAGSGPNWDKKLCEDSSISPQEVHLLAFALQNISRNMEQKDLVVKLLISASSMDVPAATYQLMNDATRANSEHNPKFATALLKLRELSKSDSQAMSILGTILHKQGREQEALNLFNEAIRDGLNFTKAPDTLCQIGSIYAGRKDYKNAIAAYQKAATVCGDPRAYMYLGTLEERGSAQQKLYFSQAAQAGNNEACHILGILESENVKKSPKSWKDYGMAGEWFRIAAYNSYGLSMLNIAIICKNLGDTETGRVWLENAEKIPGMESYAAEVRKSWDQAHIELMS